MVFISTSLRSMVSDGPILARLRGRKNHDRALKRVKQLKKAARKEFQRAKREGLPPESIRVLAQNFFTLVREHNKLKRVSHNASLGKQTRKAKNCCHHHFWRYAKELLDDGAANQTTPQFGEEVAADYFKDVYHSTPKIFNRPDWMPTPQLPTEEFYCEEIASEEVQFAIKHMEIASTPSPFDQVSYMIFKRCPSLRMALVDLFNYCWAQSEIPSQWKIAAIKLIGKISAADDPTSPSNFRPIALTSCVGKLFTTILRNRWLSYMTTNGYLDRSVQKAFMKATPGCIEHQSKLAAILAEARKTHKSLAVCWLDLANAYSSVHHSLIQFSIQHYHALFSSATSSSHFTRDSLVQSHVLLRRGFGTSVPFIHVVIL